MDEPAKDGAGGEPHIAAQVALVTRQHVGRKDETVGLITDLPPDVLNIVLQNIGKCITRNSLKKPNTAAKVLALLSITCKYVNTMVDDNVWKAAWDAYVLAHSEAAPIHIPACSYKEYEATMTSKAMDDILNTIEDGNYRDMARKFVTRKRARKV